MSAAPSVAPAFSPAAFSAAPVPFAAAQAAPANGLMDDTQDRFMTLLVTQLRNQDPLNPMDNAGVTSQIAQLSTVNGIEQLNKTLQAMSGQMDFSQAMQASALIGKGVLVPGEKIRLGTTGAAEAGTGAGVETTDEAGGADRGAPVTTPFGFELYADARTVKVEILDETGQPVRTLELGQQPAGVHALQWDGLNDAGEPLPEGAYRVRVTALDGQGKALANETLSYGKVGSVAYAVGGLQLDLGLAGKCSLYDIRQVM